MQNGLIDLIAVVEGVVADGFYAEGYFNPDHFSVMLEGIVINRCHGAQVALIGYLGRDAGICDVCTGGIGDCSAERGVGGLVDEAIDGKLSAGGQGRNFGNIEGEVTFIPVVAGIGAAGAGGHIEFGTVCYIGSHVDECIL